MKSFALVLLAIASAAVSTQAQASAELAKTKNCMACHAIDKKIVGPAFKDVATKYQGQKGAAAKLATSITKGSQGNWGAMAMPPNALSEADATALAQWVLSQK